MRAWIVHDFNDMRLEELPEPGAIPARWARIRVRAVQPSITECLLFRGLPTYQLEFVTKTLKEGPAQLFGHEYCGEVLEVGSEVTDLRIGQRVASRSLSSCGECWLCRHARSDECQKGPITGFQIPGCFAEIATVPADTLVPIPDHVSDSEGAALQALTDAVAGVAAADLAVGSVCVVIGQGVMGLGSMQAARVSGAGIVVGVDVRDVSLELSAELGADVVIDARSTDPLEAVLELTGGRGADVVIDAAGGPPEQGLAGSRTLELAAHMVRDDGVVVGTALLGEGTFLAYHLFRHRAIRYVFPSVLTRGLLRHVVNLVSSRRILIEPTISAVLQGIESVPDAFQLTERKGENALINPAQVIL
jgi:(R,R)-butanediol dehydrogenase / meso-butanediol dehydrogenase / diacetyl reductase